MTITPMINTLIITTLSFPLVPLLHIGFLRLSKAGRMKGLFFAVALYGVGWFFLIRALYEGISLSMFLGGAYMIGFLSLGYAEFFSMISRGFSLHILTDVYRAPGRTLGQILNEYSGKGARWMMEKRIPTLVSMQMLGKKDGALFLKGRGAIVGHIGILVKNILKLGGGG